MISLVDWYLVKYDREDKPPYYLMWGFVFGHQRLADGMHIRTSGVEDIYLNDVGDRLLMHTQSGNDYELLLADISLEDIENTQVNLKDFNVPAFAVEKCQELKKLTEDEIIAKVDKITQPNELYLLQYGVLTRSAYFKCDNNEIIKIPIMLHSGMVQDSYLVTDWGMGVVDFRYFDKPRGIEPYHWNDGLQVIKIDNVGRSNLSFYADTEIICKVNEITVIESSQYGGEGLLSPDVVNGKLSFDSLSDDEKNMR